MSYVFIWQSPSPIFNTRQKCFCARYGHYWGQCTCGESCVWCGVVKHIVYDDSSDECMHLDPSLLPCLRASGQHGRTPSILCEVPGSTVEEKVPGSIDQEEPWASVVHAELMPAKTESICSTLVSILQAISVNNLVS